MALPLSIESQFRRLDKFLSDLKLATADGNQHDIAVVTGDICNACVLLLDKSMNAIWEVYAETGKSKPNIYFPLRCESPEKLMNKLTQYQMPKLHEKAPRLFALLESIQPYLGCSWSSQLSKLSSIRHESFPETEHRKAVVGVGIGRGQNLYIDSLTIDSFGKIDFKGIATNSLTGKEEPVNFSPVEEIIFILKENGEEPYHFCRKLISHVRYVCSQVYFQVATQKRNMKN